MILTMVYSFTILVNYNYFFKLLIFLLFYVYVCTHAFMFVPPMYRSLWRSGDGVGSSGSEVKSNCGCHVGAAMWVLGPKSGPLKEQQTPLVVELSIPALQLCKLIINFKISRFTELRERSPVSGILYPVHLALNQKGLPAYSKVGEAFKCLHSRYNGSTLGIVLVAMFLLA